MELGISSLGNIIDLALSKKYESLFDLLFEASEECLKYAEEQDIKICELVLDPPDLSSNENVQKFSDLCNSFSIKKQIHGPFIDLCLCSLNKTISKASVKSYVETAKICEQIEAEILTIHPGLANFLLSSIRAFNKINLIEAVNKLLDSVANSNVMICIENMPKNTNILLDEKELEIFLTELNRDDIFLTFDTSHAWTCDANISIIFEKFHNLIKNVHLVDNFSKNSDTHPTLGSGKIDFQEIFKLINKYDYKGSCVIELSSARDLPQSIEFIQKFM